MNRLWILIVFLAAVTGLNCDATHAQLKVQRVPLARSKVVLGSPATYEKHARLDPKTGNEVSFDPRPRVEAVDAKSGKYVFKWIGYDGKEKVVAYQRADVIVSGSMSKLADGNYLYTYEIENLTSSHSYLSHFIVQCFAADTRPIEVNGTLTGYEGFPEGTTIGPVASAKSLSASDRANSIRERLPQFEKLGWMTASARLWYDKNLKNDDWPAVLAQAQQGLNTQQITTEIFALLQAIQQ